MCVVSPSLLASLPPIPKDRKRSKQECVVSPSLLASLPPIPTDWKPPKQFLFGLGWPWEPYPWEYDDNEEDDEIFVQASQVVEQQVQETSTDVIEPLLDQCPRKTEGNSIEGKNKSYVTDLAKMEKRWDSPKSYEKIANIRRDGIPKVTQKQTEWCLAVWFQWASYRQHYLFEGSEKLHPLSSNFLDMAKGDIQFWISKFVAEAKHKDGTPYAPNSLYQICCGLGRGLNVPVVQMLIFLMLQSLHCFRIHLIPV